MICGYRSLTASGASACAYAHALAPETKTCIPYNGYNFRFHGGFPFTVRLLPEAVLKRLAQAVLRGHRIVISAITYSEMRFGATGPKASPRHVQLVDAFCARLDAIQPWDRAAVDASTDVKVALRLAGTPIGPNDTLIAGHAIAASAILVTNNVREFERVPGLKLEDWVN